MSSATRQTFHGVLAAAFFCACSGDDGSGDAGDGSATESATMSETTPTSTVTDSQTGTSASSDSQTESDTSVSTSGMIFDVGFETETETGTIVPTCKVVDDMDAVGPCSETAPPDSFEPDVQWVWGENPLRSSSVIPLVANLTDDNDDGEIDLCDIPDIIINAYPGEIIALDGATGAEHWTAPVAVKQWDTPALGDIDGDGLPEIVTRRTSDEPVAINHDGTIAWTGNQSLPGGQLGAMALADMDNDGDVEMIVNNVAADHMGNMLWAVAANGMQWSASALADLDGDDDLEILVGASAYHHDGSVYYNNPGISEVYHGTYPQVADVDDDGQPEILLMANTGASVLEHNGTIKFQAFGGGSGDANRPANIHDFDGDNTVEFGASALMNTFAYGVYEFTPAVLWTGGSVDSSGQSGGAAFDFLGAGVAQAMYADETQFYAYDEIGTELMMTPRSSLTQIEYPVVADVDNDGSAEVVVVSNPYPNQTAPGVQVIRDVQDRWIQARRIWNQHTYHVTNVREDGTIPQIEPKHWTLLNTFRTQAQIEGGGGVCKPEG